MDRQKFLFKDLVIMVTLVVLAGAVLFSTLKNFAPSYLLTAPSVDPKQFLEAENQDVEKYINLTYPYSEKTRLALKQFAEAMEASILDADDKQVSIVHKFERLRALQCLLAFYPYLQARQMVLDLKSVVVNTPEKVAAWAKLEAHYPLNIFSSPYEAGTTEHAERKFNCNFDPDKMAD